MTDAARLLVRCYAKINTVLHVHGRRADGFHDLDTEFVAIDLHDLLEIERRPAGFELAVEAPGEEEIPIEDNLVLRAARALQREVGAAALPGAGLRLHKRIPAAAGLGGGSADAAAALEGLCRLHGLDPGPERLAELALDLGSDVPFFLQGGRCRGTSRGEVLTVLPDREPTRVLLVVPPRRLSTAAVFGAHARRGGKGAPALTRRKTGSNVEAGRRWTAPGWHLDNDLKAAALELAPDLARVEDRLHRSFPPERVGLTGSGPTLFVILAPGESTEGIQDELASLAGVALFLTRTLGRREYHESRFAAPRSA